MILCAALAACGGPDRPLLTEMSSFRGRVQIECRSNGEQLRLAGELMFDHETGNLQFTQRGAETVTLAKLGGGPLRVYVDAVPVKATERNETDFRLVAMVVHSAPAELAQVTRPEDHYVVELDDFRLRVDLEELPDAPVHGGK